MSEVTQKEYWKEVREMAQGIIEEGHRQDKSGDDLREWSTDYLHEAIDNHEWVIYTWANPYVLIHCSSGAEDALFENQGAVEASSYSQIIQLMAFYALYEDVAGELSKALDELNEEDSGVEDEEEDED